MSAVCRSCGADIEWAITVKGRRIPLDVGNQPTATIEPTEQLSLFGATA